MLENASVSLTYRIEGTLKSRGKYEYRERTSNGNVISDEERLFTKERPKFNDSSVTVTLNEDFVNMAISEEGRPKRNQSNKAFTFWNKWTEKERLHWHINKYVMDRGGHEYKYQILEA